MATSRAKKDTPTPVPVQSAPAWVSDIFSAVKNFFTQGQNTSEYFVVHINAVVQEIVAFLALIHPGFSEPQWVASLVPLAAQICVVVGYLYYVQSRTQVKVAAAQLEAQKVASAAHIEGIRMQMAPQQNAK